MTEADWLACDDPEAMIEYGLFDRGDRTKLIRLTLACASRLVPLMSDHRSRRAMEAAERYLDGVATKAEIEAAEDEVYEACWPIPGSVARTAAVAARNAVESAASLVGDRRELIEVAALSNARNAMLEFADPAQTPDTIQERRASVVSLLRDIFGNPFRPVTFSPEWRTDTAIALAARMYESRDFSAMPILADALQDAGCENEDVLNHCRQPGIHVRGCWCVDLISAKS